MLFVEALRSEEILHPGASMEELLTLPFRPNADTTHTEADLRTSSINLAGRKVMDGPTGAAKSPKESSDFRVKSHFHYWNSSRDF